VPVRLSFVIGNTIRIAAVVATGRLFDRQELDALLEERRPAGGRS
jgi:hypothetical protein